MLTFDDALEQLLDQAKNYSPPETITCSLEQACGKVLAEPVFARIAVPPFDNSAMDGIAFRLRDLSATNNLPLSGTLFAGQAAPPLTPGTAVRLFTGSMIPEGADTVEMQENCTIFDNEVTVNQTPELGKHIRLRGEDIEKQSLLLEKGTRLEAKHIGLLASTGLDKVPVFKPLCIALIANGDELIAPPKPLEPGQIYNSNQPMLHAELVKAGFTVKQYYTTDSYQQIIDTLKDSIATCQLAITVGGVSVGEADFIKRAIETLGEINFWKVAMKPGKPLTFGKLIDNKKQIPVIGLPGNPVSAFTAFSLFTKPFLLKLQGQEANDNLYKKYPILLNQSLHPKREEFLRVKLIYKDGLMYLLPFKKQGSGVLSSIVYASGFARLPRNKETHNNDEVVYIPFND